VGALKTTPAVAARSIVAPDTDALPLVNAYTVNVTEDVPFALIDWLDELMAMDATFEFAEITALAAVDGALGVPDGVPALPPPPPQATKAIAIAKQAKYL